MTTLNKDIFLAYRTCPRLAWLKSKKTDTHETLSDQMRMQQGLETHGRAYGLFPGALHTDGNFSKAVSLTQSWLRLKKPSVILEAAFTAGAAATKSDIINPIGNSWELIEVKSSTNYKEAQHLPDLSYTYSVASRAGLNISKCTLWLLSKEYRLGMDDNLLFANVDLTSEVMGMHLQFESEITSATKVISTDQPPKAELIYDCKNCGCFEECFGRSLKGTIFQIPRIRKEKFESLASDNIFEIIDVPAGFKLSENQLRVVNSAKTRCNWIDKKGLKCALKKITYPIYYLDFETLAPGLPLFEQTKPYTQIPTQYSVHKLTESGHLSHFEYLAPFDGDWRRELAENLLADLGKTGSIVIYTGFENTAIKYLASQFVDLTAGLEAITQRTIDLHKIVTEYFYHPDFWGSTSIKSVLPALVPDLSYEGMEVCDGGQASALFWFALEGRYGPRELACIRKDLLEYCKLDTLAMVKVHEKLSALVIDA